MTIHKLAEETSFQSVRRRRADYGKQLEICVSLIYHAIVRPSDTVIDGGANAGAHALPLASLLNLTGHLHCFEPIPGIAASLTANLARAGLLSRCSIHAQALSDADATAEFIVNAANPALSHIRNPTDTDGDMIVVPTRRLDGTFAGDIVGFIKLDLQGADFLGIKGAAETIYRSRPVIAFQNGRGWSGRCYGYSEEEFFRFFEELEYRVIDLHGRALTPETWADPGLGFKYLALSRTDDRWAELSPLVEEFWAKADDRPVIADWHEAADALRDPRAYCESSRARSEPSALLDRQSGTAPVDWGSVKSPLIAAKDHPEPSPQRSPAPAAVRKLLLHYHIFKNAGTSLDSVLKRNFGETWREIEFNEPAPAHATRIREFILDHPDLSAISSHTLMAAVPEIDGVEILPLVFLRHPVDRIKSVYEFEHVQQAETEGAQRAKELDLVGYLEWRWEHPRDRVCRDSQAYRLAQMMAGEVPQDERRAAFAALDRLPFVGLVEAFDGSMLELERLAKVLFPAFRRFEAWENANRERGLPLPDRLAQIRDEVGEEFYRRIEAHNGLDLELYQELHCRFEARAGGGPPEAILAE